MSCRRRLLEGRVGKEMGSKGRGTRGWSFAWAGRGWDADRDVVVGALEMAEEWWVGGGRVRRLGTGRRGGDVGRAGVGARGGRRVKFGSDSGDAVGDVAGKASLDVEAKDV